MLYRLGCQKGGLVILGVHSNDLSNNALLTQGECMHQNSFRMQTLAADTMHAGFSLLVSLWLQLCLSQALLELIDFGEVMSQGSAPKKSCSTGGVGWEGLRKCVVKQALSIHVLLYCVWWCAELDEPE